MSSALDLNTAISQIKEYALSNRQTLEISVDRVEALAKELTRNLQYQRRNPTDVDSTPLVYKYLSIFSSRRSDDTIPDDENKYFWNNFYYLDKEQESADYHVITTWYYLFRNPDTKVDTKILVYYNGDNEGKGLYDVYFGEVCVVEQLEDDYQGKHLKAIEGELAIMDDSVFDKIGIANRNDMVSVIAKLMI
eukprot:TRINITY_DN10954_c0_g1_i1.p1 TRINITY_DN10954_c0_g1~~TRINITY_DN10954_c0_g1_i1.p1  ORF type:complete len:192 (-),score=32.22 TRINITY_DN10954_c0_g1_i1:26-601(-)